MSTASLRTRIARLLHLEGVRGDRASLTDHLLGLGRPSVIRAHCRKLPRATGSEGLVAALERALAGASPLTGPPDACDAPLGELLGIHEYWGWALQGSLDAAHRHDHAHLAGLPLPEALELEGLAGDAGRALPLEQRRRLQEAWTTWLARPELPVTAQLRHLAPSLAAEPGLVGLLRPLREAAWQGSLTRLDRAAPAVGALLRADPGRSALGAALQIDRGEGFPAVDEAHLADAGSAGAAGAGYTGSGIPLRCGLKVRLDIPLSPPLRWLSMVEALLPTDRDLHHLPEPGGAVTSPERSLLVAFVGQVGESERLRALLRAGLGGARAPAPRPRPRPLPPSWAAVQAAGGGDPTEVIDALRVLAEAWAAAAPPCPPWMATAAARVADADPTRSDDALHAWLALGQLWLSQRLAHELDGSPDPAAGTRTFPFPIAAWLRQSVASSARPGRHRLPGGRGQGFALDLLRSPGDIALARHLSARGGAPAATWIANEWEPCRRWVTRTAAAGGVDGLHSCTELTRRVCAGDTDAHAWALQVADAGSRAWCHAEVDEAVSGLDPLGPGDPPLRRAASRRAFDLPGQPWGAGANVAQPEGSGRDQVPERSLDWLRRLLSPAGPEVPRA